jgi:hypothetical protein
MLAVVWMRSTLDEADHVAERGVRVLGGLGVAPHGRDERHDRASSDEASAKKEQNAGRGSAAFQSEGNAEADQSRPRGTPMRAIRQFGPGLRALVMPSAYPLDRFA